MDVSAIVAQALRELAAESPVRLRICGNCMAPLLESGAMIEVIRQNFYWPGDPVVVYAVDGRLLGHRLLGFYPRSRRLKWLTQADNAHWPDAAVSAERIIGKICGGQCAPALVRVPFTHRAKAVFRFFLFILIRLGTLYR